MLIDLTWTASPWPRQDPSNAPAGPVLAFIVLAEAATVTGVVRDATGAPVAGATVTIREEDALAVTGADGRFSLEGKGTGTLILLVTMPGFRAAERAVTAGGPEVEISLSVAPRTEEVTVTLPRDGAAGIEALRLSRLQVLRTPGSAGDVLRALQTLPGVARADEGAGLYVHGGDASEVAVYLDRAALAHPYRSETGDVGGLFGTIPPLLVSGLSLATGGFSARHGNALSAVLDLDGMERPRRTSLLGTLGLGGVSMAAGRPLGSGAGARLTVNHSLTGLLFAVNPPPSRFVQNPRHTDASLSIQGESTGLGRLRAFVFGDGESVAVESHGEAERAVVRTRRRSVHGSLGRERALGGPWLLSVTAAGGTYERGFRSGAVDLESADRGAVLRADLSRRQGDGAVHAGVEAGHAVDRRTGEGAVRGGDPAGSYGTRAWDLSRRRERLGAYVERVHGWGPITGRAGLRTDVHRPLGRTAWDPRLELTAGRGDRRLRLAWGVYHQSPATDYLDARWGNPRLHLMRARHLVLG